MIKCKFIASLSKKISLITLASLRMIYVFTILNFFMNHRSDSQKVSWATKVALKLSLEEKGVFFVRGTPHTLRHPLVCGIIFWFFLLTTSSICINYCEQLVDSFCYFNVAICHILIHTQRVLLNSFIRVYIIITMLTMSKC